MSRRSADEISSRPDLQGRSVAPPPSQMSAAERDRRILVLARGGVPVAEIAAKVGLTARGVRSALQRIQEGRAGRVRAE